MDRIKRALEEKIISEREAQKLLSLLSSSPSTINAQKSPPSLRIRISPGGEISLPLSLLNLDENAIFRLICGVIEPDLQKSDEFNKLLEKSIRDVLNKFEKISFFYEFGDIEYEILTEIIN